MPPDLRPATPHDQSAIEDIVHRAYVHYVARLGRPPGPMGDDYGRLIAEGRVHVLDGGEALLGLVVLIPQADAMLLDNVAVLPSAQGSGLGRELLRFAEDAAREAGYRVIRLYTNEAMTENIGLYARLGYRETHRAEEKGLRRVYMTKDLA